MVRVGRGRAEASPPGAADAAAPDPCPTWAAEHVEARADNKALAYKAQQAQRAPLALAFLGDSITEGLNACGRRLAAAESALGGAVGLFGVPGDCVENLAWRLGHGGMPRAAAYCIQIGTNDLSMGEAPRSLVAQIQELVQYVRYHAPEAHIVLLSLFYLEGMQAKAKAVNNALRSFAAGAGDPHLHYSGAGEDLPSELFPDGVHPVKEAYDIVLDALVPFVQQLLQKQ
ncbi:hypothetical protein CHLNCDRAFT_134565 [Chlorella variabilis]|uniref:SGNH hydrolase-type esterase domain-containing protein n=1 Tax=Chlorella variabilis TaxID=554065 RepID=E1ZG79_CHLVA|nr:hypothetical protein CHLNCDRAFT_134565 [Chlorella variabilis]EFN55245.1 hypothetical protein CHLNCDRAFT_134565 [Chlorella variabilis]|eukprot:XP_005847347.1 hypothetical protein CHLNCDRAFT_134565 [Chlorella variabilis]